MSGNGQWARPILKRFCSYILLTYTSRLGKGTTKTALRINTGGQNREQYGDIFFIKSDANASAKVIT